MVRKVQTGFTPLRTEGIEEKSLPANRIAQLAPKKASVEPKTRGVQPQTTKWTLLWLDILPIVVPLAVSE